MKHSHAVLAIALAAMGSPSASPVPIFTPAFSPGSTLGQTSSRSTGPSPLPSAQLKTSPAVKAAAPQSLPQAKAPQPVKPSVPQPAVKPPAKPVSPTPAPSSPVSKPTERKIEPVKPNTRAVAGNDVTKTSPATKAQDPKSTGGNISKPSSVPVQRDVVKPAPAKASTAPDKQRDETQRKATADEAQRKKITEDAANKERLRKQEEERKSLTTSKEKQREADKTAADKATAATKAANDKTAAAERAKELASKKKQLDEAQRKLDQTRVAREIAQTDTDRKKLDEETRKATDAVNRLRKEQQQTRTLTAQEQVLQKKQQDEIRKLQDQIKSSTQRQIAAPVGPDRTRLEREVQDLRNQQQTLTNQFAQQYGSFDTSNLGFTPSGFPNFGSLSGANYGNSFGTSRYNDNYGSNYGSSAVNDIYGINAGTSGSYGPSGYNDNYGINTGYGSSVGNYQDPNNAVGTFNPVSRVSNGINGSPFGEFVDSTDITLSNPIFDTNTAVPGIVDASVSPPDRVSRMVSMLGEEQSLIQQLTRLATDADGNGSLDRTEFDTLTRRLLTVATQCQQVRRQLQLDPAVATISRAALPRLQDMQTEQSNFKSLAMTLQNPNASIKDLRRTLVDLDLAVSRSTRRTGALLA